MLNIEPSDTLLALLVDILSPMIAMSTKDTFHNRCYLQATVSCDCSMKYDMIRNLHNLYIPKWPLKHDIHSTHNVISIQELLLHALFMVRILEKSTHHTA